MFSSMQETLVVQNTLQQSLVLCREARWTGCRKRFGLIYPFWVEGNVQQILRILRKITSWKDQIEV